MVNERQERVTLPREIVEKLNEFLTQNEHGKKISVDDLTKDVVFVIRDYIKEHS